MKKSILEPIRQPEYTGENRCVPCTVVNLVIAGVLSVAVARRSRRAGVLTAGISAALIYLRGYLVPGTPALTKRYLPPSVLRLFGKQPEPTIRGGFGPVEAPSTDSDEPEEAVATTPEDGVDDGEEPSDRPQTPEAYFLELDVLEPCAAVDDLCLTDEFESAWFDEIEQIEPDAIDATDAAAAFGLDADEHEFEIESHDEAQTLRRDGRLVGQWPSQPALVADVAAASILESWDGDWDGYEPQERGELLNGLRLFLETCPTSGGDVVLREETVESCCQSHDVVAAICEETDERLFEHPVPESTV
ncbi:hypothetical protein [Natronobeatus ordinarius]|uniref:hypothetical protein n=1 Tax=Natronobeatus ordinarius TaxID=2963433 RepID=UPI0020CD44E3|nr:hypothetical protein [Natronobeatus ordinarius]